MPAKPSLKAKPSSKQTQTRCWSSPFLDALLGIADNVRDGLFHEAVTTKAMSALVQGQGLVSAQDCLATFGGQLKLHHTDHQGSIFHLALPWHKTS